MSGASLTEQYLSGFAASAVRAGEILDGVRPSTVDTGFMGRSLSRPAFLDHAAISRLSSDLEQLHVALTGLPDRLFGGDMAAFARAVGATETQADIILRGSGSVPSRMGRADFYRDDSGFRLLEINWGAALGGLDCAILNREMMRQPFIGDFIREHQLGYVDPMVELVHTLFTECKVPTGSTPAVALADWPESYKTLEPRLRRNVEDYARFGIEAHPCHIGQLRYAEGRVWLDDVAIDVVYRLFLMEDLLDEAGPALIEPVLRAAERGEVTIFSPMDADLYGSKGALALLSDEANRQRYPAETLAILDRILPWTRMVRSGPVTVSGASVDLVDYALANQRELIIKPTLMHGGIGIVAGWLTQPADWRACLAEAMDRSFILQRRIHPVAEKFPTDSGTEDWTLTWGAFMAHRGYGGMFVRGSRDPDGTVNMSTGATATCCFTEVGPPAQPA
ncbi:MAG TPA: hypothetical protein VF557_14960 [Jatrophihabitans sp.]|jgi:hypothetical protein|uniref:hypothetical protein n=1 Tax=Jatrophihabitans sp. TaxID=1932789 RepID=UPI002F0ED88D